MLTYDVYFDRIGITKNIDKEMYVKMKSRKLRAVLAALSAVAVLATAMTGFAATVTTTTEYYANESYAHVISVVSGANGDVTYLATTSADEGVSSSGILYIDQKYTSGEDITFDYYVNKGAIDGTNTTLALGTNGTASITQPDDGIKIYSTNDVDAEGYTITYSGFYGNGDEAVTAVIEAKANYEIKGIKINGVDVEDITTTTTFTVPVIDGQLAEVIVDVEKQVLTPSVEILPTEAVEDGKHTLTTVFKLAGEFEAVGVKYNGVEFPAVYGIDSQEYVAVKIINDVEFDGYETFIR